jgi:deoxyribose-phosphate aldolase
VAQPEELAKVLESTLLRPTASAAEIDALCQAALDEHFGAVVVFPVWIARASALLARRDVRLVAAIAHPYGAESARAKLAAVEQAIRDGADEVDVVASLPALAARDWGAAREELAAIVRLAEQRASGGRSVLTKAVIETCYLDEDGIRQAARTVEAAGCDFVVTSTGVGPDGATERGVEILRQTLGRPVGVKAAGGIMSVADAEAMLAAGAQRLGTTVAAAIADESRSTVRRR